MSSPVSTLVQWAVLLGLYLFFARVLWLVWQQVRPASQAVVARVMRVVEPARLAGDLNLSAGPVTIGRHRDCDMSLPDDEFLSQRHLMVGADTAGLWVDDLGSTNGTFVDEHRITDRCVIRPGSRVSAGSVVMVAR